MSVTTSHGRAQLDTPTTCFFERDPEVSLVRRVTAEVIGTLLLMLAATGAGLTAQRVSPDQLGFVLLASAGVTAGVLVSLIVTFGSVSGGHFNPLITGLQWFAGQRKLDCTLAYITAQTGGALLGGILAKYAFGIQALAAVPVPPSWPLLVCEFIASARAVSLLTESRGIPESADA
jgi:glycerol uptake facilitator-like aquaporin